MSAALRCDGCQKLSEDTYNEDDIDRWSFRNDWLRLERYSDDGKQDAYWWVCSWDCLACVMLDHNEIRCSA